jgi:hypothetical protein
VISSEMVANEPSSRANGDDPRQATMFAGRVLHHRASYANDRRIVLCHATEKSCMMLTCATDHALETTCSRAYKSVYSEDFGQVAFTIEGRCGCSIDLTKYLVYHTSQTALPEELCARAERTLESGCRAAWSCRENREAAPPHWSSAGKGTSLAEDSRVGPIDAPTTKGNVTLPRSDTNGVRQI